MTINSWEELSFWSSEEYKSLISKLNTLREKGELYNPKRSQIFRAFEETPFDKTKVLILGQDPYPDPKFCTGLAFSIPKGLHKYPPTLVNIFREYCYDLHLEYPSSGCLLKWCKEGVLLLNSILTCKRYLAGSHRELLSLEYSKLITEVISNLSTKGIIFIFLGAYASTYSTLVATHKMASKEAIVYDVATKEAPKTNVIYTLSHPSPLSAYRGFLGSRIFSKVNDSLVSLGQYPIRWRLS